MKKPYLASASAVALIASAGLAEANTVNGQVWETNLAASATLANEATAAASSDPTVTFTEQSPLSLSAGSPYAASYTVGGFLNSQAGATIGSPAHGLALTNSLDDTLFNFTGTVTVTTGQTFTFAHDDGLTFVIGTDTVVNAPGPTASSNTTGTYTGVSGNETFQLVYGEACGPPAVLEVNLPLTSATPLPAALPLFAGGLGLLGLFGRRKKQKGSAA
jgi:hypothetical protein